MAQSLFGHTPEEFNKAVQEGRIRITPRMRPLVEVAPAKPPEPFFKNLGRVLGQLLRTLFWGGWTFLAVASGLRGYWEVAIGLGCAIALRIILWELRSGKIN